MIDISYRNYSSITDRSRYQTSNGNRKNSSGDVFKTRISGNAIYVEQISRESALDWEDLKKIPGKYALKDGNSISVYHSTGNCGYKFFHAAESTDDYPVLVAKGVDWQGKYFEEKINVKQIDPYNTSTLELQALAHFKPGHEMIGNPYDCMQGQEKGLRERFSFVSGAQTLINAWKRIGHAGQAAQWRDELNFLLSYTENTVRAGSAAKERLVTSIAKKCSEDLFKNRNGWMQE